MTQSVAEVIILAIDALGAGILMFVAGVVQNIMNELDELEFKRFFIGRTLTQKHAHAYC
jgi:hypothetical protein